jgi:hypothetical protein
LFVRAHLAPPIVAPAGIVLAASGTLVSGLDYLRQGWKLWNR